MKESISIHHHFPQRISISICPHLHLVMIIVHTGTLVKLHIVRGLQGTADVAAGHVVVHECGAAEDGEAAGTTQDTAEYMLSGLLKPVTDGVLEHLIPHHGT